MEQAKSDDLSQYDILDTVAVVKDGEGSESSQPIEQPEEVKETAAADDSLLVITSGATSAVKAATDSKKTGNIASNKATANASSKKKSLPVATN